MRRSLTRHLATVHHWLQALATTWLVVCSALLATPTLAAEPSATGARAWQFAKQPGAIILMRHAQAPGVGDPPNFLLTDCSTQRNLDSVGQAQARQIGLAFKQQGVVVGAVRSSQWCRTRETAELAFAPLPVTGDPAFNSFFAARVSEPAQTAAARNALRQWRGPGALVVVTHQVNITALTGQGIASGDGYVVQVSRQGDVTVLARLPLDGPHKP